VGARLPGSKLSREVEDKDGGHKNGHPQGVPLSAEEMEIVDYH